MTDIVKRIDELLPFLAAAAAGTTKIDINKVAGRMNTGPRNELVQAVIYHKEPDKQKAIDIIAKQKKLARPVVKELKKFFKTYWKNENISEGVDKKLFILGRKIQDELHKVHGGTTLRPKDSDFSKVAKALGIKKTQAIKAWNVFTWG